MVDTQSLYVCCKCTCIEINEKRELLSDEVEDKVKFRIELIYFGLI